MMISSLGLGLWSLDNVVFKCNIIAPTEVRTTDLRLAPQWLLGKLNTTIHANATSVSPNFVLHLAIT